MSWNPETEKGHIRRVKRVATLAASSLPQASTAPHWEGQPRPTFSAVERKQSPRYTSSSPALQDTSQEALLGLIHRDHCGNQGLTTKDQREMEKGAELTASSAKILAEHIPLCSCTWAELCPSTETSQWPCLAGELTMRFCPVLVKSQWAVSVVELFYDLIQAQK